MWNVRTLLGVAFIFASAGTSVAQVPPARSPDTGATLKVTSVHLRNANVGLVWAEQGFIFSVQSWVSHANYPSCSATSSFFVSKTDPANPSTENPLYKDYLAAIIAANALDRNIAVFWNGCLTVSGITYLRVVGLNVVN